MSKQKKEEAAKKRKDKEMEQKKKRDHEAKKKQIADYKAKRAITQDLLANADLDDYYDEYGDDVENDEQDASRYLDRMLMQYKQRAQDTSDNMTEDELLMSVEGKAGSRRPPPAVL